MSGKPEPLQGRWHGRFSGEAREVESYLDVNDELFFFAAHVHRGAGAWKSRQAVCTIERFEAAGDAHHLDLAVLRWVEDGVDRSGELGGSRLRALCRREGSALLIAFSAPDGPRPPDLSGAEAYTLRK